MEQAGQYHLALMFDGEQIDASALESDILGIANPESLGVKLTVESDPSSGNPILEGSGSMDGLERCYGKITKYLSKRKTRLSFIRLRDDVGKELRRDAYAIVAEIELALRVFIDRTATARIGLAEWNKLVDIKFADKIKMRQRDTAGYELDTRLECLDMPDLIALVELKGSMLSPGTCMTVQSIVRLFAEHGTLESCASHLQEQMTERSAWDAVFQYAFASKDEWDDLSNRLGFPCTMRNRIMHHRAITASEIRKLSKLKDEILPMLDRDIPKATENERALSSMRVGELLELLEAKDKALMKQRAGELDELFGALRERIIASVAMPNMALDIVGPIVNKMQFDFSRCLESICDETVAPMLRTTAASGALECCTKADREEDSEPDSTSADSIQGP